MTRALIEPTLETPALFFRMHSTSSSPAGPSRVLLTIIQPRLRVLPVSLSLRGYLDASNKERIDLRTIPLGDIDLRSEIRMDREYGVVNRRRVRACVRSMYTARIDGRNSDMTVALYQGRDAEEVSRLLIHARFLTWI